MPKQVRHDKDHFLKMTKLKKLIPIFIILILSFWAIFDILKPGFFPVHDDTQVVRVYEMAQGLRMGQFPVRWVPDLGYGYGYAIFNFYSPLPYYTGGFLNLIGFDALMATKLMFLIGILLSGISMYCFAREFWGKIGGIFSAILYVYAPYHLLDIYVRGAVGEFWAIAFLPLVFLGVYKFYSSNEVRSKNIDKEFSTTVPNNNKKWLILTAFAFSAVILSHNITALLLIFFLGILYFCLLLLSHVGKPFTINHSPLALNHFPFTINYLRFTVLALALTAFFLLPAIFEASLTKVGSLVQGTNDFRLHFVCLSQFWNSPWGFGGSVPGCTDGLSFQIGKFHLIYALLGLISIIFLYTKLKISLCTLRFALCILGLLIFSVFMMLQSSEFLWNLLPPLSFVQYPWRFLAFTIVFVSFFSGAIIAFLNHKPALIKIIIILILFLFPLIRDYNFTKPRYISPWKEKDYVSEVNIKWKTSKISDEYLPKDFPVPKTLDEINLAKRSGDQYRLDLAKTLTVNTPLRLLGNLISLIAFCIVVFQIIKIFRSSKKI